MTAMTDDELKAIRERCEAIAKSLNPAQKRHLWAVAWGDIYRATLHGWRFESINRRADTRSLQSLLGRNLIFYTLMGGAPNTGTLIPTELGYMVVEALRRDGYVYDG